MTNFTSNTYQLKREILNFSNKISNSLSKPTKKFSADMTYGILASESCLLTDITDSLLKPAKKINVVDRLSSHLERGVSNVSWNNYRNLVKRWVPSEPVIHIDDSDVVKPDDFKFKALGTVLDSSESTPSKNIYKKGYPVTEACATTESDYPVSIFSRVHSSSEKGYKSTNSITYSAIETGANLFEMLRLLWTEAMMTTKYF